MKNGNMEDTHPEPQNIPKENQPVEHATENVFDNKELPPTHTPRRSDGLRVKSIRLDGFECHLSDNAPDKPHIPKFNQCLLTTCTHNAFYHLQSLKQ